MKTLDLILDRESRLLPGDPFTEITFRENLIAIFESECARLEGKKLEALELRDATFPSYYQGYCNCLDQQIAYYQEILKELNK